MRAMKPVHSVRSTMMSLISRYDRSRIHIPVNSMSSLLRQALLKRKSGSFLASKSTLPMVLKIGPIVMSVMPAYSTAVSVSKLAAKAVCIASQFDRARHGAVNAAFSS